MDPSSPDSVISRKDGVEPSKKKARHLMGKKLLFYSPFLLFFLALFYIVFSLTRQKDTVLVLYNPEQMFEQQDKGSGSLEEKKTEILNSLNVEINEKSQGKGQEDTHRLSRLDRLWRSVKKYISQVPKNESRSGSRTLRKARLAIEPGTDGEPLSEDPLQTTADSERVLYNVLLLAKNQEIIRKASLETDEGKGLSGSHTHPPSMAHTSLNPSFPTLNNEKQGSVKILNNFESRDGVRTRGIVWKLHKNLSLEGSLDTTQVGETDPDLHDFGFRSVHALTFLRDQPTPSLMGGWDRIDSGYPRSYGIGLNLKIAPSVHMLFDYSHEYPNDYFIEYKGNWESSLMADFAKYRPEDENNASIHNFFFGLHYLHRDKRVLIPLHTGFFYSTSMAVEPLPSEVSMGFSLGGGYHKKDFQLGLSYRLRIWQNPDNALLIDTELDEEFNDRIANQVLFYLIF